MDRDKVLYHFSEEADITYCGGFNDSIFHYPHAAFAASRDYSGEGQDSLSLALRSLARLQWRGRGFSLPHPTVTWELSGGVFTDETAAPIHRAPSQQ